MPDNRSGNSPMMFFVGIVICLCGIAAYLFGGSAPSGRPVVSGGDSPDGLLKHPAPYENRNVSRDREILEALKKRIDAIEQDTHLKNNAAYKYHLNRMELDIASAFWDASSQVETVVSELTSWKGVTKLSWYMVKDKVTEAKKADAWITGIVKEKLLDDLIADLQEVETQLAKLNEALEINRTRMNTDLAQAVRKLEISNDAVLNLALRDFTQQLYDHQQKVGRIAKSSTSATAGIVVTGLFIRQIVNHLKNVIGFVVRRFIKIQVVSGGLAAADGPFPFGDALMVVAEGVGLTMCAHGLYKARMVLKPELEAGIEDELAALQVRVEALALQEADRLLTAYVKHEHEVTRELKAALD